MAMNAANTVYDVKRLMGRTFQDPQVQEDLKKWPFKLSERRNEYPKIDLSIFGEAKSLLPEEVMAMILARAKKVAEEYLKQPVVTEAVITVPTMFGSIQRQAVMDAARIAGLTVLRLLNETKAAALAYGMEYAVKVRNVFLNTNSIISMIVQFPQNRQIALFYHLGAGAFDVAIVEISNGRQFNVLGVEGNSCLGGIDFDDRLVQHFADEFDQKNDTNIRNNIRAMRRLRTACESLKKILSTNLEAVIDVDSLLEGIDFSSRITRVEFEAISDDLFEKTFNSVGELLAKLKLDKFQIDEVFVIGASTRIPVITKWHEDFFGAAKMNYTMNAEEIVITGAAFQVGMLTETQYQEVAVDDTVSLPLSMCSSCLCTRDKVFPLKFGLNGTLTVRIKTPNDDETSIVLKVFETSDSTIFKEWFIVEEIPSILKGVVKIDCHFSLDENGVFSFSSAECVPSLYGFKPSTARCFDRISDFEMRKAIGNSEVFAQIDYENKRQKKARVEFENSILLLERKLTSSGMAKTEISVLRKHCAAEMEWLEGNLHSSVDTFEERLLHFRRFCAKKEFIQYLDSMRSDAENLPESSGAKMQRYLDRAGKWIESRDDYTESVIETRKSDLQNRYQEFIAKHRHGLKRELKKLVMTLHEQIYYISQIHGDLATEQFGQLCDAELVWLKSDSAITPETLKKRLNDFIGKRDVLLKELKVQKKQAISELASTCNTVKDYAFANHSIGKSSMKKTYDEINLLCDNHLEWLKKNKAKASVEELRERTDILKEIVSGRVAKLVVKYNLLNSPK
jgi:heat shock 70kDa protein 1/2/6/8